MFFCLVLLFVYVHFIRGMICSCCIKTCLPFSCRSDLTALNVKMIKSGKIFSSSLLPVYEFYGLLRIIWQIHLYKSCGFRDLFALTICNIANQYFRYWVISLKKSNLETFISLCFCSKGNK